MDKIDFIIEEAIEGGYVSKAINASIFTEEETMEVLECNIKEAINCHLIININYGIH